MAVEVLQKALKEYKKKQIEDKNKGEKKGQKTPIQKKAGKGLTHNQFTEKTTLAQLPQDLKTQKILAKHGVPCISCPHVGIEQDSLTMGFISKAYGIDLKALLDDLNRK
jgi:hypothetical protein